MALALRERLRIVFAPPQYLAFPLAGIEISTSSVKAVRLAEGIHGFTLAAYSEQKLPPGACVNGEVVNQNAVVEAVAGAAKAAGISSAVISLPESKSFLFETTVPGATRRAWRLAVEQHLDELVPIPPAETIFDIIDIGAGAPGETRVVGVGFARRIVDSACALCERAHVSVRAIEGETFAFARAILPFGDDSTTLIIDVGKTTTKMAVVTECMPRFATTIGIGGHALTLAVQKYFGVTESEARKIKAERGIAPASGNEEYLAAMLSTVSAICDEIKSRFEYWQERAALKSTHEPVSQAILIGGNSSVRGLPEYFEGALRIPVKTGNVFANFASHDQWVPSLDYTESLAYAAPIGLALYDHIPPSYA